MGEEGKCGVYKGVKSMVKLIHSADWHCRDEDLDEVKKCLRTLGKTVKDEEVDIVVIAGDIFDSQNVKLDSKSAKLVFEVVQEIADLAPVAIVTGTKSHDGTACETLKYIRAKNQVFVSTMPEQIYLMQGGFFVTDPTDTLPILTISQVPTPTKQHLQSMSDINSTNKEIAAAMSGIFGGFGARAAEHHCPHVLVGHFSVGGAFLSPAQQMLGYDIEISKDQISLAGADLVALGHIHFRQKMEPNIFYSGSIFQQDFGEVGEEKGFYFHTIDNANRLQRSQYILSPSRKLFKITHDFTNSQNGFRVPFTSEMLAGVKDAVVQAELKIFEDEVSKIDRDDLELNLAEAKEFVVKIIRVPRTSVRSEKILKLHTLREKIIELARLRGEEVANSILKKADALESMTSDEILAQVAR